MLITEPVTTFTDYAIALESLIFAGLLFHRGAIWRQRSIQLWGAAFAAVAVAAALGGTCHGFIVGLGDRAEELWQGMVYALSAASFFMLLASIKSSLPRRWRRVCYVGVGIKTVVVLGWMMSQYTADNIFSYGAADYLFSMLVVLILTIASVFKSAAAGWIVAGVLTSVVAIGLQSSNIDLAEWFNHNDLYHLVQILALYLFFRGSRRLKDA
ncbi:hypothetical protein IFO70_08545 [Phormidium tenue FACHB-886]|nr:hypothetical protein [Phormidium tenue FACHB-886]